MKTKRYKICLGVMMMCALLNGCSLSGTEHTSVKEEAASTEEPSGTTAEITAEEITEKTAEGTPEKTTEATMTETSFVDTTLIDFIGQDIDDVINSMGKPDIDSRSSSEHYWTQQVLYNQNSDDQIWFEFWYGDRSTSDTNPLFEKVYFVCAQARKFFELNESTMDIETFIKNQNVKEHNVYTLTEESFLGDTYTVIGSVGDEVLVYTDGDGCEYQVVLNDHTITPNSLVGVTGQTNREAEDSQAAASEG